MRYLLHAFTHLGETNTESFDDYMQAYKKFTHYQNHDHSQLEIWDNHTNKCLLIWNDK